MTFLENALHNGRDALHPSQHDEKPVTPPKYGHRQHDTASEYMYRSDTTKTSATSRGRPPRPYLTRVPTVQTRYMEMLLHLDRIPRMHNILAATFGWILLAGFLVIPGTFTSFQKSKAYEDATGEEASKIASEILKAINNVPLLYISAALSGIGALGCIWLWFRWSSNYVWLINRIFLPTVLSSLAGVLSTIVNVYSAREGVWSMTAKIAAIVTGSCTGISLVLFLLYNFWALRSVRQQHNKEFPEEFRKKEKQKKNETIVDKVKRKVHEPAIQPGSIV